jgi:hypothetical protein
MKNGREISRQEEIDVLHLLPALPCSDQDSCVERPNDNAEHSCWSPTRDVSTVWTVAILLFVKSKWVTPIFYKCNLSIRCAAMYETVI